MTLFHDAPTNQYDSQGQSDQQQHSKTNIPDETMNRCHVYIYSVLLMLFFQTYVSRLPLFSHCEDSVSASRQSLLVSFHYAWMRNRTGILLNLLNL